MKKAGKIILYILGAAIIIVAILLSYVKFALPNVGDAPVVKVELTPEKVERGKYLANHVTVCMNCHSMRDWTKLCGPIVPGTTGAGGDRFDEEAGLPGVLYSANITPYNLGSWTDGEIFRAITTGVKKDGSAIFPIMPYKRYRNMDKEDIYAIIAYLRTLPPLKTTTPPGSLNFPLNFIVNTIPEKAALTNIPPPNTPAYNGYIINAAACFNCHSNEKEGKLVGEPFAGNHEFKLPQGSVFSANITPDKETGIGNWTKEAFVARFKAYSDSGHIYPQVVGKSLQTVMPWESYSEMKTSDLEAIYDYLQALPPVKNQVTKFVAAKS